MVYQWRTAGDTLPTTSLQSADTRRTCLSRTGEGELKITSMARFETFHILMKVYTSIFCCKNFHLIENLHESSHFEATLKLEHYC